MSGCSGSACRCPRRPGAKIQLSDEWRYAALAEAVEAWGFRREQGTGEALSRPDVAEAWFREEYEPVVEMLQEADLAQKGTATETYMRVSHLRYLILRTHDWDDSVIGRLREELDRPSWDEDTMVKRLERSSRYSAYRPARRRRHPWRRVRCR